MTVAKTERETKTFHARFNEMCVKFNALLDYLTINKIADVSHLRITGPLGD